MKTYTCDVCKQTKEEVIKAKGHTLEETIVKEPTCGEAGLKSVRCTVCGYEDAQVEIPATGNHNWSASAVTTKPTCDIVNIGLHFFLKNVRPHAASCSEA